MIDKVNILFSPLIDAIQEMAVIDTTLSIIHYDIYNALKGSYKTVNDVAEDQADWKSVARDTCIENSLRIEALQNNRNQKAAPTALRNLNAVFDSLLCV